MRTLMGLSRDAIRPWLLRGALLAAAAIGCATTSATSLDPPPGEGLNVLFIGNSLTYWNDLPSIARALADSAGGEKMNVRSVAYPDFSLEDHWNQGDARRAIALGNWDVVVLQQGPSSLPESRVLLLEFVRRFGAEIKRVGAKPALYMVWPSSQRQADFERSSESYRLAAQEVDGMLFAVGDAWRATWRRDANIVLYSPDGLHPSPAGSYLAALVMVGQLYSRSPVGLPSRVRFGSGGQLDISASLAGVLQAAAAEVNGATVAR